MCMNTKIKFLKENLLDIGGGFFFIVNLSLSILVLRYLLWNNRRCERIPDRGVFGYEKESTLFNAC